MCLKDPVDQVILVEHSAWVAMNDVLFNLHNLVVFWVNRNGCVVLVSCGSIYVLCCRLTPKTY